MMDCWGTIEPVDLARMEETFEQMSADRSITLDGTHFASLINAYGCVAKDLSQAIMTFQSIDARAARGKFKAALPDHICWEALINVFVVHHRADLLRESVANMKTSKIHMTPYVANLIIKGLSQTGDMAGARETFESLVDPPTGFAGHVRAGGSPVDNVSEVQPTYREVSKSTSFSLYRVAKSMFSLQRGRRWFVRSSALGRSDVPTTSFDGCVAGEACDD